MLKTYQNISYIISYTFLMLYFCNFISLRFSKKKSLMICSGAVILTGISEVFMLYVFSESPVAYILISCIQIIITQATALFISKTRDSKAIFTGLSGSNYIMAGGLIGGVVFGCTDSMVLALAINIIVHVTLLVLLITKIQKIYLSFYENKNMKNWWGLCLIPALFYCSFVFLAIFPNSIYDHQENILGVSMLLITMFISYVLVFRYVENETDRNKIYWENKLFESYIQGLESQYEAVEASEYKLRILRHDMRHYLSMINSLLEQNEYQEIQKIIANVQDVADDTKIHKYCENIKVNSIISSLMERAEALEIEIGYSINVPETLSVNDLELASVIANLLENAIHSVKELDKPERKVDMLVRCMDKRLIIEVKNKCGKGVVFNPVTGLPLSSQGKEHGMGLQSVSAFADKIGANFDCYCEGSIFIVRMLANF